MSTWVPSFQFQIYFMREQVDQLDTPELMSLATVASSISSARQLLLVQAT